MSIAASLKQVRNKIQTYAKNPDNISLIAVTKNRSIDEMNEILTLGVCQLGENRVQEAVKKFPFLSLPENISAEEQTSTSKNTISKIKIARQFSSFSNIQNCSIVEKHFIGHLQKNKVALAVEHFDWIDSVDSIELARKIDSEAAKKGKKMTVLIQVNISEDSQKYGIDAMNTEKILYTLSTFKNLEVKGLMTIGKKTKDKEEIRRYYKIFYQLFKNLQDRHIAGIDLEVLSMGMSDDYEIALEEGSNMIRLGRILFQT